MHTSSDKYLSRDAFANMGIETLVYIRPVTINGHRTHALCAADGTKLTTIPNRKLAFAAASQYELTPLSVH